MSRMSVSAFLSNAKSSLAKSLKSKGERPATFVIGNGSADLDSITCAIVYSYVQSSTASARKDARYMIPVTNIPAGELRLRPELTALLKHANLKPSDLITLDDLEGIHDQLSPSATSWTLVDHNVSQGTLGETFSDSVTGVIDHHDDEGKVPKDAKPRIIEKTGSCSSHVVNYCRDTWQDVSNGASATGVALGQGDIVIDHTAYTTTWDAQVAKLALGAILIDTVNLSAKDKVTEHDRKAVKYLEAKINISHQMSKTYDRDAFYKEINDAKSDLDELSIEDILAKDYKEWTEGDIKLGISSCVRSIDYLETKQADLMSVVLPFIDGRELDVYAIMTAHNDDSSFQRQLLLVANSPPGKMPMELPRVFEEEHANPLLLGAGKSLGTKIRTNARWTLWEQENLAASRKQVAPMLRQMLRQYSNKRPKT